MVYSIFLELNIQNDIDSSSETTKHKNMNRYYNLMTYIICTGYLGIKNKCNKSKHVYSNKYLKENRKMFTLSGHCIPSNNGITDVLASD